MRPWPATDADVYRRLARAALRAAAQVRANSDGDGGAVKVDISGMTPLRAALRGYGEASKGEPCPICGSTGCDHTVLERLRAALNTGEPKQ